MHISTTELGEFVRYRSCERRIKISYNNRAEAGKLPFYGRLFNAIDPVLQDVGKSREDEWAERLRLEGINELSMPEEGEGTSSILSFLEQVTSLREEKQVFMREVELYGRIGAFDISGRVDFIILLWGNHIPILRIVECKASRKDRTYHRIQVAVYKTLLAAIINETDYSVLGNQLSERNIEAVVGRIDEDTNQGQDILRLPSLVLDREIADVNKLLEDNGLIQTIVESDIDRLSFQLDPKCDDCVFNIHCLSECGRTRRLELLGIDSASVSVMTSHGIDSIDTLASLDLSGEIASAIRAEVGFSQNLDLLQRKARARRATLPHEDGFTPGEFPVMPLGYIQQTGLPEYIQPSGNLVRIYLGVDYDYVENRIAAISAHITDSLRTLRTRYDEADIVEIQEPEGEGGESLHPIRGESIVRIVSNAWSGNYAQDNGIELALLQSFFRDITNYIARLIEADRASIHFYVWSRGEIRQLMESCARLGSNLLEHFQQLLGCRQQLEQLIYTCVEEEVKRNFGLGWTGRGLAVVSSLSWYDRIQNTGKSYSWRRIVNGEIVPLDHIFTQDIFDFKTDLGLNDQGEWAAIDRDVHSTHKFEIRSRFRDSLTVPYFHAYWDTLPDPDSEGIRPEVRSAIRRYLESKNPNYLETYLSARMHALRWVEEKIPKNEEIIKPAIEIASLSRFSLNVHNTRRAALNFLVFDFHVKFTDWLSQRLLAPINRITNGSSLPLSNVRAISTRQVVASIDLRRLEISLEQLAAISSIQEDGFARFSPCDPDLNRGQTIRQILNGGLTCNVESLDWNTGNVTLSVIPYRNDNQFIIQSYSIRRDQVGEIIYENAMLDSSISDFVSNKVHQRLVQNTGQHVNQWFDPERPIIPPRPEIEAEELTMIEEMVRSFRYGDNNELNDSQINAIMDGFLTRVQLLLGPPGTGKTLTTAISLLLKIFHKHSVGDVIVISGNTHLSVNELLERLAIMEGLIREHIEDIGYDLPPISLAKVDNDDERTPPGINCITFGRCVTSVAGFREHSVLVVGGTINGILKMADNLDNSRQFPGGFDVETLVVDESSMLVFPAFLAISTLTSSTSEIMLAGDHRQLSPIVSHDWEREDRPPVILYQPYLSAFDTMRKLSNTQIRDMSDLRIRLSPLDYTYRLPEDIRILIGRLYQEDNISLVGRQDSIEYSFPQEDDWRCVWRGEAGIFLVLHNERKSRKSNPFEVEIISRILDSFRISNDTGSFERAAIPDDHIAIITPHRAQRTLLQQRFWDQYETQVRVIDTVERLQGGEKDTIIVSATASDPSAISATAEFILNLNRANVAFSRSKRRLIVVCSETLVNHIPADMEYYDSALLWKTLRKICSRYITETAIEDFSERIKIYTFNKSYNEGS